MVRALIAAVTDMPEPVYRPGLVDCYCFVQPPCMIEVYVAGWAKGQSEFSIESIVTLLSPMLTVIKKR